MRLSTAEARLRPDEAVLGTRNLRSREPTERPCEQVSETSGRIGDGKELCRVAIDGIGTGVPDDLIELRSEVVVAQSSGQHIGPRGTRLRDRLQFSHELAPLSWYLRARDATR